MKTVLRIAFAYMRKNIKRTVFTFISVAVCFMITFSVCWLCGVLIEDSRSNPHEYSGALGFAVMFLAVAFAVCYFIVNGSFDITISSRLKLMGLLTSVGATGKQKYGVLFVESLFYAISGGFSGTACAYFVLKALYQKLYASLGSSFTLSGAFTLNTGMIIIGIIATVLSVFASTVKPFLMLVRITPVDAMKCSETINVSLKQSFFASAAEKAFGYYGRLAGAMYENHKRKYKAIALSLSVGTAFYVSCYCFGVYYPLKFRPNNELTPMTHAFMLLAAIFVGMFLISSLSSASLAFDKRKSEYAMLKSVGMTNGGLCKLVLIESLYLAYHSLFYALIGSVVGDIGAFLIFWGGSGSNVTFGFPILVFLAFLALDTMICVCFSLYNLIRISRLKVVEHIKQV